MQPSIDALAGIGINVRDMNGEMRSTFDILEELAGRWSSLSAEQQQNMAVTLAGRFQLSRFLVLMQQWSTVNDVVNTSLQSQGSSLREQAEYSKSLEARLNRLSNAGVELSQALGDAILTDSLVIFAESVSSLANSSRDLIRFVGILPPVFGGLATVLALVSTRFRTAILDMNIFKRSADGLTISTKGLTTALRGMMAATGIGLAFAGVGFVIEKVTNLIGENIRKREELQEVSDKTLSSLRNEGESINDLVKEYEKLSKINRNIEQEERYTQLQNELAQLLPAVKTGEDEKGNSIIANTDAVKDYVEALEKQLEVEEKARQAEAQATISSNRDSITERIEKLKDLEKAYEDSVEAYNQLVQQYDYESDQGVKDTLEQDIAKSLMDRAKADLEEFRQENVEIINDITQAYAILAQSVEGISVSDSNAIAQLAMDANLTETEVIELSQRVEALKQLLNEDFSFGLINNLEQFDAIEEVSKSIKEGSDDWVAFNQTLKDTHIASDNVGIILGNLRNSTNDVAKAAEDAGKDIRLFNPVFSEFGEIAGWVSKELGDLEGDIENQEEAIDELLESYKEATSAIKDLNGVINELNEGNGISADTISMLMEKYPHLLQYIYDEAELRRQVEKAIQDEVETSQQSVLAKLGHNEQFFNEVLKGNKKFFDQLANNYNIDLRNHKSLNQAKLEVEQSTINAMAKGWQRFYRTTGEGMIALNTAAMQILNPSGDGQTLSASPEARRMMQQLSDANRTIGSIVSSIDSVVLDTIGINFSNIGLKSPSSSKSGSSKSSSTSRTIEQYVSDDFQRALDNLNRKLAESEFRQGKLVESSEDYRKELSEQINIQNKMVVLTDKEIARLNKRNRTITSSLSSMGNFNKLSDEGKEKYNQLSQELDNNIRTISQLNQSTLNYRSTIHSLTFDRINSQISQLEKSLDQLAYQMERNEKILARTEEGTREYFDLQSTLINQHQERAQMILDERNAIMKLLSVEGITIAQKEELIGKLNDLSLAYQDVQNNIHNAQKTLRDGVSDVLSSIKDDHVKGLRKELEGIVESLETQIESTENYYDNLIKQQEERLKLLDEEIEKEDRLKKLRELDEEIEGVKADKRFEFITEDGERILTYDRARVSELEKQRDELVEQYEREDAKKAIRDEIDRLKNAKNSRIEILREELESTKKHYDEMIQSETERWDELILEAQNGTANFQDVMDHFYNESRANLSDYVTDVQNMITQIQQAFASLSNLKAPSPSVDFGIADGQKVTAQAGADNEARLSTDPNYVKSEKERAKEVIANRKAAGMDVSRQENYLKYLDKFHEGGIVGRKSPNRLTELVNKMFNTKPNETVAKLLHDEVVIAPHNMINGIKNIQNMVNSITSKRPSVVQSGDTFHFNNVTVKANDANEFIDSLRLYKRKMYT